MRWLRRGVKAMRRKLVNGRLDPFFETGTEGVMWSVSDEASPGYNGLHVLHDGDLLTIYADDGSTLWAGTIAYEYDRLAQPLPNNNKHQAIFNHWVHGLQSDLEPETWARYFFDHRRATVSLLNPAPANPFSLAAADIQQAIDAQPVITRNENYAALRYAWINWNGDDKTLCEGNHAILGFTENEAIRIMGLPSEEDVDAWKRSQRTMFVPNVYHRLALVLGITGRLKLVFGNDHSGLRHWFNRYELHIGKPMRDCFFETRDLMAVHDRIRHFIERPPHGFGLR